jgi:hypothetical protein
MMEKLAQAGEGGGACRNPFHYIYHPYKVVVYAPAERADTLPLFKKTLYVLYGDGKIG